MPGRGGPRATHPRDSAHERPGIPTDGRRRGGARAGRVLDRALRRLLLSRRLAQRPPPVRRPRAHPAHRRRRDRGQPHLAHRPDLQRARRPPRPPGAPLPRQGQPVARPRARHRAARHRPDPGVPRDGRREGQPAGGHGRAGGRQGADRLPRGHDQPRPRALAHAPAHRRRPARARLGRSGGPDGALGHARRARRLPQAVPPAAAHHRHRPLRRAASTCRPTADGPSTPRCCARSPT